MLKAAIIGATGYTAAELIRLLAWHPHVRVHAIGSRQHAGQPLGDVSPAFRHRKDLMFCSGDAEEIGACDMVFLRHRTRWR